MEKIAYCNWDPFVYHDWLGVDREGVIGCFSSACAGVHPDNALIPWPYLHKLLEAFVAFRLGCRCEDVDLFGKSYADGVKTLADLGLYVWEAEQEGDRALFRLEGRPSSPLKIHDLPIYFQRIAKRFTLSDVSFSSVSVLDRFNFTDRSDQKAFPLRFRLMKSVRTSLDVELRKLVQSGRAFKATVDMLDRCALEDAPVEIGPTFSTWESVRPCYLDLVSGIMEVLHCEEVATCEVTGNSACMDLIRLREHAGTLPLPFLSVEFPRYEGGEVRLDMCIEKIVGGPTDFFDGYYRDYTPDMHVEHWAFELSADDSPRVFRGIKGALLKLERFLKHEPKWKHFKMG